MRGDEAGKQDRRGRQKALRVVLTVLAVALGTVAVWLIVTSDNAQRTKIGALAGFWALLIAAYPVLGFRSPHHAEPTPGQELDLRAAGRVERVEDAAARLEYERRLQLMVRHEIQTALGSELTHLRSEVASLRSEILEKVGGQIRLERIETTRMIGSDIEALQHEVRQLKVAARAEDMQVLASSDLVESMDAAVARQLAAAEAEHVARLQQVAAHIADVAGPAVPEPAVVNHEQLPEPVIVEAPRPHVFVNAHPSPGEVPVAAVEPVRDPATEPVGPEPGDPFDGMPRISPFRDEEHHEDDSAYAGRRRSSGDLPGGRHAGGEADWATARPGGGRRHRDEDGDGADILADILRRHGLR